MKKIFRHVFTEPLHHVNITKRELLRLLLLRLGFNGLTQLILSKLTITQLI